MRVDQQACNPNGPRKLVLVLGEHLGLADEEQVVEQHEIALLGAVADQLAEHAVQAQLAFGLNQIQHLHGPHANPSLSWQRPCWRNGDGKDFQRHPNAGPLAHLARLDLGLNCQDALAFLQDLGLLVDPGEHALDQLVRALQLR